MELHPFVDTLRQHLAVAADAGGDDARRVAERLTAPLDSAVRLVLLEALSAAADEITRELAPGSVDVRLRSGEPEFVVTMPPTDEGDTHGVATSPRPPAAEDDDGATARINLRLPERLKAEVEEAANRERLSVNAWLVRLVSSASASDARGAGPRAGGWRPGQSYSGWVG